MDPVSLKDIRCGRDLSHQAQLTLCAKWREAQSAEEKAAYARQLVEANVKYIIKFSRRYNVSYRPLLVSAGVNGVLYALERFDPSAGVVFLTFAHYTIRKFMDQEMEAHRLVRLPSHVLSSIGRVKKARALIRIERGITEPTVEEIAEQAKLTPQQVQKLIDVDQSPLSLNNYLDGEDEAGEDFKDNVVDVAASVEETVLRRFDHDKLIRALEILTPLELRVLILRYGLLDGDKLSLVEAGKVLRMSREGIRAAQMRALKKLRQYISQNGWAIEDLSA